MPGQPDTLSLADRPAPHRGVGQLLVQVLAVGVCGTDREIISGGHGQPPEGHDRLVPGHESLGQVVAALPDGPMQPGDDVEVFDRVTDGPIPDLVDALDATYPTGDLDEACRDADVVIEATGVASLVFEAMRHTTQGAMVCLAGVSTAAGQRIQLPAGDIARELVLDNDVVFGTVNANRGHYERAVGALTDADPAWHEGLITRRVPLDDHADAYHHDPTTDVKTIIDVVTPPAPGAGAVDG